MLGLRFKLLFYTLAACVAIIAPITISIIYIGSEIDERVQLATLYICTILALLISGIYILNRLVIKPLHALAIAANQLSRGNYDIKLPVSRNDEIGELTESFKQLQNSQQTTLLRQEIETSSLNDILIDLQKSENLAKGIFRSVPDGLILTDSLGVIKLVNPAICEIIGYQEHELLGNSVDILIPKKYRPKHQQKVVDFILDQKRPTREYIQLEALHKNGDTIPIEISISQISTNNKHNLVAVVHDIRKRMKAERTLRHERDRAQSYLDTAEVAIVSIDINSIITLVNRKCCELLGYSEGELLGKDYFSLCPDRVVAEEMREAYQLHVTQNETFPKYFYINLLTKDGDKRIFEWHNNTIKDYEWNTTGIILAGTDMTEIRKSIDDRKALRDRLYQSQKMQAIGQLSSGIAHDFNNLLATMMGYTELLQEMLSDHEDESILNYLKEIYISGERARDLIDGILKYSRGAKNDETDYTESLYLPGLSNEIENMVHGILPGNVELSINIRQDAYPVMIDSIKLQQIIMNLSLNAIESMHEGGELVINSQNHDQYQGNCASCAKTFNGDFLILSITDTGCGINDDATMHLFEPFYTTKSVGEVGQGAGMGLAIVHGLVHDANGHISVESNPGAGTTINIMFPAATSQQVAVGVHG